jgi:flagellar assembly protein FliH
MNPQPRALKLPHSLREVRFTPPRSARPAAVDPAGEKERTIYERGRLDGQTSLNEQLLRQRQEMIELQQGVLKALQEAVPQVVRDCERALTALTLELAQKLVAGLPITAELVEAAVREALQQVEETTDYHLYLNPQDLDVLEGSSSPLLAPQSGTQRFHFHRSPEITRGGCLVKTRFGIVDGQRESKVEALKKTLLQ